MTLGQKVHGVRRFRNAQINNVHCFHYDQGVQSVNNKQKSLADAYKSLGYTVDTKQDLFDAVRLVNRVNGKVFYINRDGVAFLRKDHELL